MSILKKTLAIFLLVCMLAGMMPVGTAFAANDVPAGGAGHTHSWNKETGKCDGCGEVCKHETTKPIAGKAATCREAGLSEGKVCATCGMITAAQTKTPVAAHTFGADGKCTVCGEAKAAAMTTKDTTGTSGTAGTNATTGAGGADSSPCNHLKDVDGAPISAFKDSTCELCRFTCTSHTWNMGGVCNTCGTECEHAWNELNDGSTQKQCSKCSTVCNHMGFFDHDGLCRKCGYQCVHPNNWVANSLKENTMKCSTCGAVCEHKKTGTDGTETSTMQGGVCTVCGFTCTNHHWTTAADKTVCSICGAGCTHPAESTAAVDAIPATCTETGREAGTKCSVCGAYTDGGAEIPALGHKWDYTDPANATCTNNGCGAACRHVESDGVTKAFDIDTGLCKVCGYPCVHSFTQGVCDACGFACKHENLIKDKCQTCAQSFAAVVISRDNSKTYLKNLADSAFDSLKDGDTITLLKNVESNLVFKNNISLILDLGTYTLSEAIAGGTYPIELKAGSLTVRNGSINCKYGIKVTGTSTLTIDSGVNVKSTEANSAGIAVENTAAGSTINVNGEVCSNSEKGTGVSVMAPNVTVNVNGSVSGSGNGVLVGQSGVDVNETKVNVSGKLHGGDLALVANGLCTGKTQFNVHRGAELTADAVAIYQPNVQGSLTIDGGTITAGGTAIEVRGGTANISGGTIKGGDSFSIKETDTGNGPATTGAGLAVVLHATADNRIDVTVSGGTISGARAIHEQDVEGLKVAENETVSIKVTGGELLGEVYSKDDRITFSGDAAKDGFSATVQATGGAVTVDNGFINAGATNTIDVKSSDGNPVTAVTLPTAAILESASSMDTSIKIVTDVAEVTLDDAAIAAIKNAVAPNDIATAASVTLHVQDLTPKNTEKTFEVYIEDANGKKIGSDGPGTFGGNVQVVLKDIATKPAQVRHYDANKTFLELPEFTYDAANKTVTVTINHFSFLALSQKAIPVITTTSAKLPNAKAGKDYSTKIAATGDPAPNFAVDPANALPKGLSLDAKTGEIKGTVDPGARTGDYSFKITASNSEGSAEKTYTLTVEKYVAAKLYDKDGKTEIGTFGTVQEAINAAQDDQTVALVEDSTDNVIVEGKNIYIVGDNNIRRKLGNITVKQKDGKGVAGIVYIESDKLTVFAGAGAALGDRCSIKTVENQNPYDKADPLPNVYIVGGSYGKLLPAKGGSYMVTGGTFETEIPMEYCRELDGNGKFVKQYYARKNSVSSLYDIAPFTFEITKVSNSGYHMPGSQKTLVFSTNLDYTLADRDRASSSITITTGSSRKVISSVYYDISEGKDGKAEITLKASTLNALSIGRYRLQYNGPTGTDYMYFHISNTVRTGDTSNIGLWLGIMGGSVVVLCAVAAVLVIKSKKKNGGAKDKDIKK